MKSAEEYAEEYFKLHNERVREMGEGNPYYVEPVEEAIKFLGETVASFVQAAVSEEREACAKECEDYQKEMEAEGSFRQGQIAKNCAEIIRDRSKKEGD